MSKDAARTIRQLRWLLVALAAIGCGLAKNVVRPPSSALMDTHHTRLGELTAPATAEHPGESGFLLFNTGEGGIQARVAMADVAQSSIDAQYFMWGRDTVGRVLLERLMAAADRGVRVRLLIDDYWASGYDFPFATTDAHPNIEIRVFNPFTRGRMRVTQLLGRFTTLNRRMHKKLFIADGQLAVIGGRNLIDDYFGLGKEICYRDFDLMAMGPVVSQAEAAFDQSWNSQWAYPISSLVEPPSQAERDRALARFAERVAADRANFPYALPHDAETAQAWLVQFRGKGVWGPAEVVYDDPNSVANPAEAPPGNVWKKVDALANQAEHEIVIENAYLLPNPKMPGIRAWREHGVRVRALTNSLATTDEVPVNAHYANVRPELVDLGVELYEMKPFAASRALYIAHAATSKAHLALHGKATVFDRKTVAVGSFNLDPRSRNLDTEIVFVVQSPQLAAQFLDAFAVDFAPENAWRIADVVGEGSVAWITQNPAQPLVEPHDPASAWRRFLRSIERLLPVAPLL
jgi:putative cardiolipin synthase